MTSSLTPAAIVLSCVFGTVNILCVLGFFALRHRTVFAIRVPEVVLVGMLWKLGNFFLTTWIFVDPFCPCFAATILMWFDCVANHYNALRKIVLLFRYEIQEALDRAKLMGSVMLDDENIYVRYRYILKVRWQCLLMTIIWVYVGAGHAAVLIVFWEQANRPCLENSLTENKAFMWSVVTSFAYFFPLVCVGVWTSRKLKSFPRDNWKIGAESDIGTKVSGFIGTVFIILVSAVPGNDNYLFWYLASGSLLFLINFLLPLQIWRGSVKRISTQELKHLAPLSRLLRDANFVIAFNAFLRSEFSSENLYFWLEADKLLRKYQSLPAGKALEVPLTEQEQTMANSAVKLVQQCIGEQAPWQINVSGHIANDVEDAVVSVREKLTAHGTDREISSSVDEMFLCLLNAQTEIYEGLRKDPYPRFLLTSQFGELNKNESLKQLLAQEKLELEVQSYPQRTVTIHSSQEDLSLSGSATSHNNDNSALRKFILDSPKLSQDRRLILEERRRSRQLSLEVALPPSDLNWDKHLSALHQSARAGSCS